MAGKMLKTLEWLAILVSWEISYKTQYVLLHLETRSSNNLGPGILQVSQSGEGTKNVFFTHSPHLAPTVVALTLRPGVICHLRSASLHSLALPARKHDKCNRRGQSQAPSAWICAILGQFLPLDKFLYLVVRGVSPLW